MVKGSAVASWTAADIPDLSGRIAVVTGSNSGLGFATAEQLARHGARVIMSCRDETRCSDAARRVTAAVPSAHIETAHLDLADLDSVRDFAEAFSASERTLDLLLNNAGVMAPPVRATTQQGFELQFGTNHLGHFALTGLLMPLLLRTPGSRIVTVSSFAHESGRVDIDNLQHERDYSPYGAYSASKLANVLFMLELERRLRRAGALTISVGAHPGLASTNLQAAGPFLGGRPLSATVTLGLARVFGQSASGGAEPQLYAATAPGVVGGEYFGPRYTLRGPVSRSRLARRALDASVASRLWDVSQELTDTDIDSVLNGAHV